MKNKTNPIRAQKSQITLSHIYRDEGVATRLQVILFYVFLLAAIASAGMMTKKVWTKFRASDENEKLKEEYSKGFEELKHKAEEKAEMVAIRN